MDLSKYNRIEILVVAEYEICDQYKYFYFKVDNFYTKEIKYMKLYLFDILTNITKKILKKYFNNDKINFKILQFGSELFTKINSKIIDMSGYSPLFNIAYYYDNTTLLYKYSLNNVIDKKIYESVDSKYKIIHHDHSIHT